MFKCKDCKKEYEIKPEYCDCGNNTFDEIAPLPEKVQIERAQIKTEDKKEIESPKKLKKEIKDLPSWIFFIVCVVLSFFVLIFKGENNAQSEAVKEKPTVKEVAENKNLPNINEIWNDTPIKNLNLPQEEPVSTPQNKVATAQTQTKPNVVPLSKKAPVQNKKPSVQNSAQNSKQTAQNSVQKPVQNSAKQTTSTQNANKTSKTNNAGQSNGSQSVFSSNNPPAKPISSTTAKVPPQTVPQAASTAASGVSLNTYKNELRNRLASSINFTKVIGDGACAIKFKVSSAGALTNRSFSLQSDNNSLNDAVYEAIMANPAYKAPPSSYSGNFMTLNVKIQGGNYAVTLN